ncbi:hypothetical protein [Pyrococcus sp. ST04]|uniref:hypothetical protein n=1 Tax=Pyrococcus sp. ST04 TaxID=1183377 RepID=UPI0002605B38|nr:hypothetical protein [Pyrococcus sp. ST04]AFK22853.1 hypothetical protein Py04_1279 [Pyrococcus sp. ST04]
MRKETIVGVLFTLGVSLTILFRDYIFLVLPSFGIPIALAYIERKKNILSHSKLFDKDTLLIIGAIVGVTILFNYIADPRLGLLLLGIIAPVAVAMNS